MPGVNLPQVNNHWARTSQEKISTKCSWDHWYAWLSQGTKIV